MVENTTFSQLTDELSLYKSYIINGMLRLSKRGVHNTKKHHQDNVVEEKTQ